MLKQILNLDGAQELSKNEQKSIMGGKDLKECNTDLDCPVLCIGGQAVCGPAGWCVYWCP